MLSVLFPFGSKRIYFSKKEDEGRGAVWASFTVNTLKMSLFLILLQLPA